MTKQQARQFEDFLKESADSQIESLFQRGGQWRVWVGVDPGSTGAIGIIAEIGEKRMCCVLDIPMRAEQTATSKKSQAKEGKSHNRNRPDCPEICGIFYRLEKRFSADIITVGVERQLVQVQSRKKSGVVVPPWQERQEAFTAQRAGMHFGMWELFCCRAGYRYVEFYPITWKARLGLLGRGEDRSKPQSREVAEQLFEGIRFSAKADHNRAEALLIAHYIRQEYKARARTPIDPRDR